MKTANRFLSAFMALAMALAAFVLTVYAVDTEQNVAVAQVNGTDYADMESAFAAADTGTVKLLADSAEPIAVEGDLYLDLNGHAVENLTVTGTVYAFDSTATATEEGTGSLCTAAAVAKDHTASGVRYIGVESEGCYTFHVLQLELTHVTLRTDAAGLYYKAAVICDPVLQAAVDSYGVALSLAGTPGADFATATAVAYTRLQGAPAVGETFTSGSVFGIFKQGLCNNAQRGQMPIFAAAYLQLADGTVVMSDEASGRSLRDVLALADEDYDSYSMEKRLLLDGFYDRWKGSGLDSGFTQIGTEESEINNALVFDPGTADAICPVCDKKVTWILVD